MIARVLALSLVAVALVPAAAADSFATRVVDRTFSCQTGYLGGVYQVEVRSATIIPRDGGTKRYGFAAVGTNLPDGFLGGFERGAVWFSRAHCRAAETSGPFSRAGLRGGPVGLLEKRIDCFTARTVLIRIRGEFARPTSLRTASPYGVAQFRASGALRAAEISVRTPSGRPFAYGSVDAKQRTLMYTAPICQED